MVLPDIKYGGWSSNCTKYEKFNIIVKITYPDCFLALWFNPCFV